MSTPKFSIIIPVYSELEPLKKPPSEMRHFRAQTVQRAIKSVVNQQVKDWELIIVDDGCADGITPNILDAFADMDKRIKVIHKENQGRCIARNTGMDAATGVWICWLDSDDEYTSHYLREVDHAIKDFPDYDIFNFGSLIYWPDHRSTTRESFKPELEGTGHVWFPAGGIGCGSFVFKRSLWSKSKRYRIPDEENPFQFAAASRIPLNIDPINDKYKYDNTENPDTAFQDGVFRQGLSLGNPVGDDYAQFYLLTRDNKSKPLDVLLYVQYPRAHEEVYTDFGELFDTGVE